MTSKRDKIKREIQLMKTMNCKYFFINKLIDVILDPDFHYYSNVMNHATIDKLKDLAEKAKEEIENENKENL